MYIYCNYWCLYKSTNINQAQRILISTAPYSLNCKAMSALILSLNDFTQSFCVYKRLLTKFEQDIELIHDFEFIPNIIKSLEVPNLKLFDWLCICTRFNTLFLCNVFTVMSFGA